MKCKKQQKSLTGKWIPKKSVNLQFSNFNFQMIQSVENKEKRMQKSEKSLCDYGIPLKETMCKLLQFQKKERGEKKT